MNTLDDLHSGKLYGAKHIKLSCNLEVIPSKLFELASSLEFLDLSNNRLTSLPESFAAFSKLRILFLSFNRFTDVPQVLAQCPNLEIVGFKSNDIKKFPEHSLPKSLRWLILTDNKITQLPNFLGELSLLEKVALAGNKIDSLPSTLRDCSNLALLRISANNLSSIPPWLFSMPKLAWLAMAGNPCCSNTTAPEPPISSIDYRNVTIMESLGQGASGVTSRALLHTQSGEVRQFAIKIFKGSLTSDGYGEDEMAAHRIVGSHPHLITSFATITNTPNHQKCCALPLIPPSFNALGNVPSFETCSRDCYPSTTTFNAKKALTIIIHIAKAATHLHQKKILHGDLYAHNILSDYSGISFLGDFGAASYYRLFDESYHANIERLDVLAFGYLVEEILLRTIDIENRVLTILKDISQKCLNHVVGQRPSFSDILNTLTAIPQTL